VTAENKNVMQEEETVEETVETSEETIEKETSENAAVNNEEAVENAAETKETTEETEDASNDKQKKEGFFKKKKDKKDEQIEELNDRVKRQMAEFDNFRKRTEKEKSQMFDMGAKNVIEKILPVVDNFERGFSTIEEADKEDAFVQGMSQVYKQLMVELENMGVKPIEAVGQEFNPDFHNAVMQVESDEYESGIIAQEFIKGYMYKDTVVRHSMVAVVQ
jgi:molecular chaperone GrpE